MMGSEIKETIKKMKEMARKKELERFRPYSKEVVKQMILEGQLNYSAKRELMRTINDIFFFFGDYKTDENLLFQIVSKERESKDSNEEFKAFIINLLGELNYYRGNYQLAMGHYQEALKTRITLFGDSHPDTVESYSNMALLYTELGRFPEAEAICLRILKIYESEISGHIEDYLTTLWNTGLLYQYWGKYSQAIKKYYTALEISQLNALHEITDSIENNLGVLYLETGNFQSAEKHLLKSTHYTMDHYGADHPKTITTFNNLYSAQMNLGKFDLSERGFLSLLESKNKDIPLTTLKIKINLAALLIRQKRTDDALKILNEALLAHATPEIQIRILSNLARIHRIRHDYQKTLEYLDKALVYQKKTTGIRHLQYTKLLGMKAGLYILLAEKEQAFSILKEAVKIQNDILIEVSTSFSRDYAWNFLQKMNEEMNLLISLFVLEQKDKTKEDAHLQLFLTELYGLILRRKAVVFETDVERYKKILNQKEPQLRILFDTLVKTKEEIVLRTTKGYFSETPEENREKVKALKAKAEVIENKISSVVPVNSVQAKTKKATLKLLQEKIPEDTLFIDIFKYRRHDFSSKDEQWKGDGYIVFYVNKDKTDFLIIEDALLIEKLIKETDSNNQDSTRGAHPHSIKERTTIFSDKGLSTLWKMLFKDSDNFYNPKIKRICISPDGDFNNLPFESLICDKGQYLIEKYSIQYVMSGRNLIDQKETAKESPTSILIFADPSFDLKYESKPEGTSTVQKGGSRIFRNELDQFPELPGTSTEAKEIFNRLNENGIKDIFIFDKEAVNDGELKKIKSPRILHLATHGFYLENRIDIHPFERCGIALSGINNILRGEIIPASFEDGILTATDILGVNLINTEIVVLSACKTGRGQITPGEGIIGLCSAMISSGVSSVLVSLWNVPDVFTVNLMAAFYEGLAYGMKKSEALQASKAKMIKALRNQWGEAPSWIWGGFVLYGDDSPITSMSSNHNSI